MGAVYITLDRMICVRALLAVALALMATAGYATPTAACFIERPQPVPEEIAARKARVAATESKALKLIRDLETEVKSSSGARAKAVRADLKQAEAVLGRLRELRGREYCGTDSLGASAYLKEVLLRIEECGTRNFPSENGKRIYGVAEAEFVLDANGALVSETILKSSNVQALDEHVSRIIHASAPFGAVPDVLSAGKYQNFVFREKFSFVRRDDEKISEPKSKCRL